MTDRRQAGSGLLRRGGREGPTQAPPPTLAALGADLIYWWEASDDTVTLNGSNVAALAERVAGVANMEQGTAANQPAYNATGGPNNRPYIELQDFARRLTAINASYASGNRVGYYVVGRAGADDFTTFVHITDGPPTAGVHSFGVNVGKFRLQMTDSTPAGENLSIDTPALDQAWRLFATRPLATGWLSQINGATTTPNFTKNEALMIVERATIGRFGADASQGAVVAVFAVNDPTAAKDAIVKTYCRYHFALTIA